MLESISLDIANYWTSHDFLTESNKNCGSLIAFDWTYEYLPGHGKEYYLTEINTNIDLSELEIDNFKFDIFVELLKKNNFTFVLGLRNVSWKDNPSPEWTEGLKEILKSNKIDYDEYMINRWPSPIPKFDIPDNVFILRYSYDEYSKIDTFAAHNGILTDFIEKTDWKKYYKNRPHWPAWDESEVRTRVIVLCIDIENLILHESYVK